MEELEQLKQEDKPLLIKFEASWCGPCKQYKPIFDEVTDQFEDQINTLTIDVEEHVDVAGDYKVLSVPTTLLIIDDEIKARKKGLIQKKELIEILSDHAQVL